MTMTSQPTLAEIPRIMRENFDKLSAFGNLPDDRLLHVRANTKNVFHRALRSATFKHYLRATTEAPFLICVSSSHLVPTVEEALKIRPNGLMDWTYPELSKLPRSEWHGTPPTRLIGSAHLSDMRFELKDFANTICGMLLPDPPWRAFLASALGRTILSLDSDFVGDWVNRDGYREFTFGEVQRT